jgi:hypothetical protein
LLGAVVAGVVATLEPGVVAGVLPDEVADARAAPEAAPWVEEPQALSASETASAANAPTRSRLRHLHGGRAVALRGSDGVNYGPSLTPQVGATALANLCPSGSATVMGRLVDPPAGRQGETTFPPEGGRPWFAKFKTKISAAPPPRARSAIDGRRPGRPSTVDRRSGRSPEERGAVRASHLTQMTHTHVGTIGRGGRLHLTDPEGWSACGRQARSAASLEQIGAAERERWCGACLRRVATSGFAQIERYTARAES